MWVNPTDELRRRTNSSSGGASRCDSSGEHFRDMGRSVGSLRLGATLRGHAAHSSTFELGAPSDISDDDMMPTDAREGEQALPTRMTG